VSKTPAPTANATKISLVSTMPSWSFSRARNPSRKDGTS
jgi:hypothetical protein